MKVIVFGAEGFLGQEVCIALRNKQYEVVPLSRKKCDITKPIQLNEKADVIINCAAKIPTNSNDLFDDFVKVNVDGIKNIVNFAKKQKIEKIIHCSTLSVNLRPWDNISEYSTNLVKEDSLYAYSKLIGEKIIYKNHLILRLPALYGPNMKNSIIDKFVSLSKANETIKANKNFHANFMYIKDVASYIAEIVKTNQNGILNIASKHPIDLFSLAKIIVNKTKSSSKIEELNDSSVMTATVNVNKMHKIFKFKETSLSDGLNSVIENQ